MDAINTENVSTKECLAQADKLKQMAERAGSRLQLERAAHLMRAEKNVRKAAETED
jgi:hypothetical protein